MSVKIHPTAQVDKNVELADGVEIDANVIIRGDVSIGEDTYIGPNTIIEGKAQIGKRNKIYFSASIGLPPQDLKYKGEPTEFIIGDDNIIREFAVIHKGTIATGKTIIGNNNLFMAYTHIAHDCRVGSGTIFANGAQVGGHVEVHDWAIIGGLSGVHQFSRVGKLAMVGAKTWVTQDVVPFALVSGNPAKVFDINRIGMRRRGIDEKVINAVHTAVKLLTDRKIKLNDAIAKIMTELPSFPEITEILNFVRSESIRKILRR